MTTDRKDYFKKKYNEEKEEARKLGISVRELRLKKKSSKESIKTEKTEKPKLIKPTKSKKDNQSKRLICLDNIVYTFMFLTICFSSYFLVMEMFSFWNSQKMTYPFQRAIIGEIVLIILTAEKVRQKRFIISVLQVIIVIFTLIATSGTTLVTAISKIDSQKKSTVIYKDIDAQKQILRKELNHYIEKGYAGYARRTSQKLNNLTEKSINSIDSKTNTDLASLIIDSLFRTMIVIINIFFISRFTHYIRRRGNALE